MNKGAFVFAEQPGNPPARLSNAEALSVLTVPPRQLTGAAEEEDDDDDSGPVYNPLSLVTRQRKRDQIILLRNQIRSLKLAFNAQFDDLCRSFLDSSA